MEPPSSFTKQALPTRLLPCLSVPRHRLPRSCTTRHEAGFPFMPLAATYPLHRSLWATEREAFPIVHFWKLHKIEKSESQEEDHPPLGSHLHYWTRTHPDCICQSLPQEKEIMVWLHTFPLTALSGLSPVCAGFWFRKLTFTSQEDSAWGPEIKHTCISLQHWIGSGDWDLPIKRRVAFPLCPVLLFLQSRLASTFLLSRSMKMKPLHLSACTESVTLTLWKWWSIPSALEGNSAVCYDTRAI